MREKGVTNPSLLLSRSSQIHNACVPRDNSGHSFLFLEIFNARDGCAAARNEPGVIGG